MTTTSSGQSTTAGSNGTPSRSDADGQRDRRAHRPDRDPRRPPAEQDDHEVARADVDVLQHPVALAVVEDRPGQTGDARDHERPERAADDDEAAVLRLADPAMTWSIATRMSAALTGLATE